MKNRFLRTGCVLLMLLTLLAGLTVSAEGNTFYLSYKKFVAAENPDGARQITFTEVAQQIENLLNEGVRRYENRVEIGGTVAKEGDDGWYKPFTNAYGFWYETSGFEKKVMGYISGARVTEVELHFSTVKKVVNNGESLDTVKSEISALTACLYEDGAKLDNILGYSTATASASNLSEVQQHFSNIKTAISNGDSIESVQSEISAIAQLMYDNPTVLDELLSGNYTAAEAAATQSTASSSNSSVAWLTFVAVFSIIIREGLEAILIVGAMVAYMVKTQNKRGVRYVYGGSILAIFASFIMAAILYAIAGATSNSIPQEFVEGITALIAVCVLIYVSNWMISKAESKAWTEYLENQAHSSAEGGKMLTLGFTAFLAVFREGAEIILFCQQYFMDAGSMQNGYLAVFGGIAAGLAVVAVVFILMRVFGVKIPLKQFFMATSILMAIMSVAFIGSGMWELFMDGGLAEKCGGFVQSLATTIPGLSWMSSSDLLDFFGIHPVWITLGPQLILLVIQVVTFIIWIKRNKKQAKA